MKDFLPDYHRYFAFLKKVSRHELRKNGFRRITTPILEKKELFVNSIGTWTDVVDNEMYDVIDKKGRALVMKPESTAWIMRAYINAWLQELPQPVYFYYIEPNFRYDRPQKGRYREFWQIWAEVIWEEDPILDAQCMAIGYNILKWVWLTDDRFKLKINSIWNHKDRDKFKEALTDFYSNKSHILCDCCKKRLETNVLRILDCKEEDCKILNAEAPVITKFFKKDSKSHYAKVKEYLDIMGVPYEEDNTLVRGLDYYCHTVWEFISTASSNSQSSLGGGWRYDTLSTAIGADKEVPGVGFALWVERVIEAIFKKWVRIKNKDEINLYFIQLGDEAKKVVLPLSMEARKRWINTLASLWTPSLKEQLKKASKIWARYVVMIWLMEAKNGLCQVKDMEAWTQEEVKQEELIDYIIDKIWEENLDFYSPSKDFIMKKK